MSQLHKRSRMTAAATVGLAVLLSGIGVACANNTVSGEPQSMLQNRLERLYERVEAAHTPEAKYYAYWSDVCDTTREFEDNRPAYIEEWEPDEVALRYDQAVFEYYKQLIDYDHVGKDSQLPDMAVAHDLNRFLMTPRGSETRNSFVVCDFMRE